MGKRMDDLQLGHIEVPRASDVLAQRLRHKILEGELGPETWLPPERELAELSGLSRGSVRDALRVLELEGLVETKPGRNGGTMVRLPDGSSVHRSLEAFIRGRKIRFRSLLEIREIIEPECAALAAQRRDGDDLDVLHEISDRLRMHSEDVPAFLTTNVEWHVAIAEASHNELFAAFMHAISREIRVATAVDGLNSEEVIVNALRAHDRIIEAIDSRDSDGARRRMRRHVCAYRDTVADQQSLDEAMPIDGGRE